MKYIPCYSKNPALCRMWCRINSFHFCLFSHFPYVGYQIVVWWLALRPIQHHFPHPS